MKLFKGCLYGAMFSIPIWIVVLWLVFKWIIIECKNFNLQSYF